MEQTTAKYINLFEQAKRLADEAIIDIKKLDGERQSTIEIAVNHNAVNLDHNLTLIFNLLNKEEG